MKNKKNLNVIKEENSKFSLIHVDENELQKAKEDDILDSILVDNVKENNSLILQKIENNIIPFSKKNCKGLTNQQAIDALKKYGYNKLPEKKKKSIFFIFLKQFKDIMILLLAIATLTSFIVFIVTGIRLNWNFYDNILIISLIEPFIILFIIFMYVILGGIQELQSQKAISSLKTMSTVYTNVIRDGIVTRIKSDEIVPGDLMLIEAGDKISADAQILESFNLICIESILTGESLPVSKSANAIVSDNTYLGEQKNKVFSGCIVTHGHAKCKVISTGAYTQLGRIASLIDSQKTFMTPLQLKLNKLGRIFGYSGLILFVVVFLIQIFILGINNISNTWNTALTTSISLAVAAIPEGLGAFTTIILSIGIKRMAKQNALIKKVSSVETLGSTSVICTDKTGTLTLNKMVIKSLWDYNTSLTIDDDVKQLTPNFVKMIEYFLLCSNSYLTEKDGKWHEIGDPTELAVILYGNEHNIDKILLDQKYKRDYLIPFDSERKLMTSVNFINGKWYSIVKGAPDILVGKCSNINVELVNQQLNIWTKKAYRVLGLAIKEVDDPNINNDQDYLENNLNFIGLYAIYDPPRPEAAAAIKECIGAGIKTVMVTGDNLDSAKAIGLDLGIMKNEKEAISGSDLMKISDEELEKTINQYSVYARVTPADKLRIIKAWQANDQVVAMTGDGVNDAPSLKAADIGCAMGITGTDVTKEAADMIIMDDNFKTIVESVSNGRKVYQTIKLVIQNVLLSSVAEIMVMFLGIIIFRYAFASSLKEFINDEWISSTDLHIFGATQLLIINLVTDGFPAIALGIQGTKENLMFRRPYSRYESIFARKMGWNLFWQGCLFGAITMVAFTLGTLYSKNHWFGNVINGLDESGNIIKNNNGLYELGFNDLYAGSVAAFITLSIGISIHALSLMSYKSLFKCNVKEYYIVWSAVIISTLGSIFFTFIPDVAFVFKMPRNLLTDGQFLVGISFVLALVPWIILEMYKLIYQHIQKDVLRIASITTFEMIKSPKKIKKDIKQK